MGNSNTLIIWALLQIRKVKLYIQVKVIPDPSFDEDRNPIPGGESWKEIGACRCDDNGVMKQISVNGIMYDYQDRTGTLRRSIKCFKCSIKRY
ncbi:hypothetical protein [Parabacteroides pacaensis]|uniref:hypothetical protein n=1 Tax=Parabacteroides pacaensis TaxID=2086575 RepID=UPI000D10F501|nr:hypothetical protein [Parabacteroides pacaensis]